MLCSPSDILTHIHLIDAHGHHGGSHAAHGPEGSLVESAGEREKGNVPGQTDSDSAMARIVGVAILEFGVMLHR
jgi:zinc transporter 1/2/3